MPHASTRFQPHLARDLTLQHMRTSHSARAKTACIRYDPLAHTVGPTQPSIEWNSLDLETSDCLIG